MTVTRRDALRALGLLGMTPAAGLTAGCSGDDEAPVEEDSLPRYSFDGTPGPETMFSHGVASGDPLPDGVILWTRVTPDGAGPVDVWWEIGTDRGFRQRVEVGTVTTDADRDFTVKVDVSGLLPGKTYYYRFFALGRESVAGRTRTAPDGDVSRVRFVFASCSNYAHGYFHAYRKIAERRDLDVVLHLGDYIYEYGNSSYGSVREYDPPHEIVTLEDYRRRYAHYRRDADLQEAHRQHPFIVVWDDHESANDSYKDGAENHDPATEGDWAERKAAAIQAYVEWMPIRDGEDGRIYRKLAYGNLVDFVMLDTRLWGRDKPLEGTVLGGPVVDDPERTLLGLDQEAWLAEQLDGSPAKWKIIGQQVMMAHLKTTGKPNSEGGGDVVNYDQWNGYESSRGRFFDLLEQGGIDNVIVLTGDIHSSWASDLSRDPNNPAVYDPATGMGSLAVEFVTPAITSPGLPLVLASALEGLLTQNPHIHFAEPTLRGYVVVDVTRDRVQGEWYLLDGVEDPAGAVETFTRAYSTADGENRLVEQSKPSSPPAGAAPAP